MSELIMLKKEMKRSLKVSLADALMVMSGIAAGLSSNQASAGILSFCVLGYFFQKSIVQLIEFAIPLFLFAAISGMINFYQLFLLFLFFCLLILFVRVIHASLFHWMPWIVSSTGFLMMLVVTSSFSMSVKAAFFSFVLMKLCSNEKILVQKDFIISEMMFSVLCCLWVIWLSSVLSVSAMNLLCAVLMCAAALTLDASVSIAVFLLLASLGNARADLLSWLLPSAALIWMKQSRLSLILVYPLMCTVSHQEVLALPSSLFVIGIVLCLPKREDIVFLEQENEQDLLKVRLRNSQKQLQHHLNQFSQLFDLIADYYQGSFQKETEFLRGMSSSMSRLSLHMKQCALSNEDEAWKITELLKGYHYDIVKAYVAYGDDGSIQISITLYECVIKDVEDVILPLLQMNVDQSLRVVSCRKVQKLSGLMKIDFSGKTPYRFKTKVYRVLNEEKVSGDTCSVFQVRNHTICTISDGMGAGKKASKASCFVTELSHRLLSCGMPIEHIVKCINSICTLNDNEHFATLDFMCFDSLNHQVAMAKNGAAPSYLIRGKEVLKIEGHSLPLGIIHQIEADCYQMEVKRKDIFLMCSDGCDESMIQKWLKCSDANQMKHMIEKTLNECEKRDDMSVIVAEVL